MDYFDIMKKRNLIGRIAVGTALFVSAGIVLPKYIFRGKNSLSYSHEAFLEDADSDEDGNVYEEEWREVYKAIGKPYSEKHDLTEEEMRHYRHICD